MTATRVDLPPKPTMEDVLTRLSRLSSDLDRVTERLAAPRKASTTWDEPLEQWLHRIDGTSRRF